MRRERTVAADAVESDRMNEPNSQPPAPRLLDYATPDVNAVRRYTVRRVLWWMCVPGMLPVGVLAATTLHLRDAMAMLAGIAMVAYFCIREAFKRIPSWNVFLTLPLILMGWTILFVDVAPRKTVRINPQVQSGVGATMPVSAPPPP